MEDLLNFFSESFQNIPRKTLEEIYLNIKDKSIDEILKIFELENNRLSNQPIRERPEENEIEEKFTVRCEQENCNQKRCYRYHNPNQRRRPLSLFQYQPKPCFDVLTRNLVWTSPSNCNNGDSCLYAHTENELIHYVNPTIPKVSVVNTRMRLTGSKEKSIQLNFQNHVVVDKYLNELNQKIEKVRKEISAKSKDIEMKKAQIPKLNHKIELLRNKFLCCGCGIREYEYINFPCGHVLCGNCKASHEQICQKCWGALQAFRINN